MINITVTLIFFKNSDFFKISCDIALQYGRIEKTVKNNSGDKNAEC
jgi:hypothetical protein